MKKVGVIVGIIIVIGVLGYFYMATTKSPIKDTVITPEQLQDYTYKHEIPGSAVEAKLQTSGIYELDELVRNSVMLVLESFQAETTKIYYEDPSLFEPYSEGGSPRVWLNSFEGKLVSTVGDFANYLVTGYEYTGGAHGNPSITTYVWDTQNNVTNPLRLSSLFSDSNNEVWLQKLSEESRRELRAGRTINPETGEIVIRDEFDERSIEEGTKPNEENFINFLVEKDGLRILFSAYQIGPYAIGQPEIRIPWSNLSGYVNPQIVSKLK